MNSNFNESSRSTGANSGFQSQQYLFNKQRDLSPIYTSGALSSHLRDKSPVSNSDSTVLNLNQFLENKEKVELENIYLKKQLRSKEADMVKQQAVLEQRLQLLEIQVKESTEREENLKKFQEKMIQAFNPSGGGDSSALLYHAEIVKELQIQNEMLSIEVKELKIKQAEWGNKEQQYIIQIEDYSLKLKSYEDRLINIRTENDTVNVQQQVKIKELQMTVEQLSEDKIKLYREIEENQNLLKHNIDYFSTEKKKMTQNSGKKLKNFEMELDKIRQGHEQQVAQMRQEFDRERKQLSLQIDKLENSLKVSQLKNESQSIQNITEVQNKYLKEIQDLNNSLSSFKKQNEEEVSRIQQEKEELQKKLEYYEKDIQNLKQKLKKAKDDVQRQKESNHNKSVLNEEKTQQDKIYNYKQKIKQLKQLVQKQEQNEKKMKNMMIEKENEHDQEVIEIKRILNAERKKFKDLQESSQQFKINYEKLQEDIYKQVKEKDKKLNSMSGTINDLRQQLIQISQGQSMLNTANMGFMKSNLDYSPEAHREILVGGSHTMLSSMNAVDTLKNPSIMMATKILELGQEVICGACGRKYGIKGFMEHIEQCNPKDQFENRQLINKELVYGQNEKRSGEKQLMKSSIQSSLSSLHQQNPLTFDNDQRFVFDSNMSSVQYASSMDGDINDIQQQQQPQMNLRKSYERLALQNSTQKEHIEIMSRLLSQEKLLSRLSSSLDDTKLERDRLQSDLDKTILELKRTKIELALCEERKNESEVCYKNEIKYLIDKLLKTKNKLQKERKHKQQTLSDSDDDSFNHQNDSSFVSTSFIVNQMRKKNEAALIHHSSSSNNLNQHYLKNALSGSSNNKYQDIIRNENVKSHNRNSKSSTKMNNTQRNKMLQEMEQKALHTIQQQQRQEWQKKSEIENNKRMSNITNLYNYQQHKSSQKSLHKQKYQNQSVMGGNNNNYSSGDSENLSPSNWET